MSTNRIVYDENEAIKLFVNDNNGEAIIVKLMERAEFEEKDATTNKTKALWFELHVNLVRAYNNIHSLKKIAKL